MNRLLNYIAKVFGIVFCCGLMMSATIFTAHAETKKIQDFFGTYLGESISDSTGKKIDRDLKLVIKPHKQQGFSVQWTTIIHREKGPDKVKKLYAKFAKQKRPGVFASEMTVDVFGNHTPHDPLDGEPFFWAGLKDDTLTVHTLFIHESGGYEMHIYKRQLVGKKINVEFERIINGNPEKTLTAELTRAKDCDWNWVCTKDNQCGWHSKNCKN